MPSNPGHPSKKSLASELAGLAKTTHIPPVGHPLAPAPTVRDRMEAQAAGAVSVKDYDGEAGAAFTQVTVRLDVPRVVVPAVRPQELRALDLAEAEGFVGPHYIPGEKGKDRDDLDQHQSWSPVENGTVEPTPGQARIMLAVERGLAAGVFYTRDMDKFVREDLGEGFFTPEANQQWVGKVEGGMVGMEIYYAQGAYEKRLQHAKDRIGAENVEVGMVLKNRRINHQMYSTLTVTAVDKAHGRVELLLKKRGSRNTWTGKVGGSHSVFLPDEE